MKIHKCDRCGKIYEPYKLLELPNGGTYAIRFLEASRDGERTCKLNLELCYECACEFLYFLSEGQLPPSERSGHKVFEETNHNKFATAYSHAEVINDTNDDSFLYDENYLHKDIYSSYQDEEINVGNKNRGTNNSDSLSLPPLTVDDLLDGLNT